MEVYAAVRIHECGKEDRETVLLIHPLVVKRDYFEPVIPLLPKGRPLLSRAVPADAFAADSDFAGGERMVS